MSENSENTWSVECVEHDAYVALQTIEKIVDIPEIQTQEAVLHEFDDEELCCDDLEEICYMTRMSRKPLWRRVWHDCSSPSDASKSERSGRMLSRCLCYEDEFDEMKADVCLLW